MSGAAARYRSYRHLNGELHNPAALLVQEGYADDEVLGGNTLRALRDICR